MSHATRATGASYGGWTTGGGCASSPRSSRISPTSNPLGSLVRSRPFRIAFAIVLAVAIVSPAVVVFAVVWNTSSVAQRALLPADTEPTRLLPAPDVQQVALPPGAVNVYANTMSGVVPCPLCELPPRVYVPNSTAGTVDVIDPRTFAVIDHFNVGYIPHHIAPAWDMSALYVDNEGSSSLTVIDINSGRPTGQTISIPWPGADHLDFSADGSYLMISTEYSGVVAKVDTVNMRLAGYVDVGGLPIDVRLSPDGTVFYVTNQGRMGVSVVDPVAMKEIQFIPTGRGAHGLQVSRDTNLLYVSNRLG